jgi:transcriptional regulator of acetoin/glycerol metabolism
MFDNEVVGVLAVQSYQPDAYDEDDMSLVQDVADLIAMTLRATQSRTNGHAHTSDLEPVVASMPDALLVLDEQGRLVRLNHAARRLLSSADATLILGHPVDRAQADRWPLGTRALTEQLRPIVDQLKRGDAPDHEIQVDLDDQPNHRLSCRASVLMRRGAPAGGLMVFREVA